MNARKEVEKVRRISLTISDELDRQYMQYAKKMGTTRNAVILMAMKSWMDGQQAMEARADLQKVVQSLQDTMQMARQMGMPEGVAEMMEYTKKVAGEAQSIVLEKAKKRKSLT
jgi:predicted transcriptional regulator